MEPRRLGVGVDWGDEKHAVCLLAERARAVCVFQVAHRAADVTARIARWRAEGDGRGLAIETPRQLVVPQFLAAGFPVFAVNPKVREAWRDGGQAPAAKTDEIDASILAGGRCDHRRRMTPLAPDDEATRTLARLGEDETRLIGQGTALVNGWPRALTFDDPHALAWFTAWAHPTAWDFVLAFPDPLALRPASNRQRLGFLHAPRVRLTPARPRSRPRPCWLARIDSRKRIPALFAAHPDHERFASLPGAGDQLAPRLLSHFGANRNHFPDAAALPHRSGTVPVAKITGKQRQPNVLFRRACQIDFRQTMHLFADASTLCCPWAKAFYHRARSAGQSHARAWPNRAAKWLKILFRMWQERQPYDQARYLHALIHHRSPLVTAMKSNP